MLPARVTLLLALTVVSNAAVIHKDDEICSLVRVGYWPEDKRDFELTWATNEYSLTGQPLYRLEADPGAMAQVWPGEEFQITLTSTESDFSAKRFLIWAESKTERECGYGKLRSASEASQHISYDCPRYLVERSRTVGHSSVPFTWEAPKCGCTDIRVMILDESDELFTPYDDPHCVLTVTACVENFGIDDDIRDFLRIDDDGDFETPEHAKRRLERRRMKTFGKKACCKEGTTAKQVTNDDDVCEFIPSAFIAETAANYQVPFDRCAEIFTECCHNEKRLKKYRRKSNEARLELAEFNGASMYDMDDYLT